MGNFFESLGRADIGGKAISLSDALNRKRAGERADEAQEVSLEGQRVDTERTRNLAAEEKRKADKGQERILVSTIRANLKAANPFASEKHLDSMEAGARSKAIVGGEGEGAYIMREDINTYFTENNTPAKNLEGIQISKADFSDQKAQATAALNKYRQDNPNKGKEELAKDKNYLALLETEQNASAGLTHYVNAERSATGAVEQSRKIELERVKAEDKALAGKLGQTMAALRDMNSRLPIGKKRTEGQLQAEAKVIADIGGTNAARRDFVSKAYIAVKEIDGTDSEARAAATAAGEAHDSGFRKEIAPDAIETKFRTAVEESFPDRDLLLGDKRPDDKYTVLDFEGNPARDDAGKLIIWGP